MSKQVDIVSGSFKELWKLSFPLMVSFLSLFVMIFVDRIFLSFYSTAALNAATSAGTFCWSFLLGWTTLASLAEVFVAQYNGSKQYKMIGEPVWQMIWLGVISFLFFIPAGLWGGTLFYGQPSPENYELPYFNITMLFGPASVFLAALTAFFVGQGKTFIIKWLALLGNLINIILDPILIFGIKGVIPSMGINGACIATGIGIITQVVVMLSIFLNKKNSAQFNTHDWSFKFKSFKQCFRIGLPPAIFVFFELLGWAIFYWMMTQISSTHILVASICQSILLLFVFFGLGLEKGAAAVAGNLIGSNNIHLIKNVLKSGIKLIALFSAIIALFFIIYPDLLINWFFKNPQAIDTNNIQLTLFDTSELVSIKKLVKIGLIMTGIHITFEYLRWLLSGILTAAGDTMFLMFSGALCVWFFIIIPTYFFIMKPKAPVEYSFIIWIVYSICATAFSLVRFYKGKWKNKALVINSQQEEPSISKDYQKNG